MKRVFVVAGFLLFAAACAATTTRQSIEPRYVAVHNTLAAMGLAEVGPIQRGSLAEGRDTRIGLDLGPECTTLVAIGGAGVADLDVSVLDPDGKEVARDATTDAEAAVKVCPTHPGKYSLVLKMTRGAGDFMVATWTGGASPAPASAGSAMLAQTAEGTCDSPLPLVAGTVSGNTRNGRADNVGKNCGNSDSKELVYRLELEKQQRVTIDVDPSYDSILYIRRDDCGETDAEVACNDDAPIGRGRPSSSSSHASRIEEILDPGVYFVFVDGYQEQVGSFRMTTELAEVPSLADACQKAHPLSQHAQGSLTNAFDHVEGSCGAGKGPEVPYTLSIPAKARARVTLHAQDFSPVVHLRRTCTDDASELGCTDSAANAKNDAALVALLDAGSYTVFADSTEKGARGSFTLDVDLTPDGGRGVRGDACADAIPIAADNHVVTGDTFDAKDDFAGQCTAAGAPDMMYRFELTAKSRVTARFESEEGTHAFVLSRSCTDRSTEIACGATFDEVLAPGVYSLAVDGKDRAPFGRFAFHLYAKDVSLQDAACKSAPAISLGQTITSSTTGVPDRFVVSCGGRTDAQASGDRVYRLTVPTKQRVQLLLTTPNYDGVLALRRACVDPPQMRSVRDVEVGCSNDAPDTRHSKIDTTLDAGTYYIVVDGHQGRNEGTFTLEARAGR